MINDFIVPTVDTDAITICKSDYSSFTEDEIKSLTEDLNSQFDEGINWEFEFYIPKIIILKAKNYILYDGKKIKIKGSALRAPGKPLALREMINRFIDSFLNERDDFKEIYLDYIKEAANIKDIKRWANRKTISNKTLNSERTNEKRIKDTIEDSEYVEGDRIYVYNKTKTELELVEKFDGQYDLDKVLTACYNTVWIFENILDCENLFLNYALKRNKKVLEELINGSQTSDSGQERLEDARREAISTSSTRGSESDVRESEWDIDE